MVTNTKIYALAGGFVPVHIDTQRTNPLLQRSDNRTKELRALCGLCVPLPTR